jgi:glycosyltransferase involved in cell wall biosynthesis
MTKESQQRKKVIFINSHPIQYFVPLYQYLTRNGMETECWYCSDENIHGHFDRQFGTRVAWDIPLLEGYTSRFFPNKSWKPSLYNGFFGLINPGLWRAFRNEKKSVVVVHGWNYLTHVMAIVWGKIMGHEICLRGESPLNQEMMKSSSNRFIKKILLQGFLFRFVNRFLFIGEQNKAFYKYYGVPENKLLFAPYSVDNERFSKSASDLDKTQVRSELGLPQDAFVVLFTAKFIDKKRPMDLLQAFETLQIRNKFLVMVGDGDLRSAMETFAVEKNILDKIRLTGFVNQTEIVKFYAAADVFVLCSGLGETWGLSVNEAMNFDLPVIVSKTAGSSGDLVRSGSGYVFEEGNINELASALTRCYSKEQSFDPRSVVSQYSFERIARSLETVIFAG